MRMLGAMPVLCNPQRALSAPCRRCALPARYPCRQPTAAEEHKDGDYDQAAKCGNRAHTSKNLNRINPTHHVPNPRVRNPSVCPVVLSDAARLSESKEGVWHSTMPACGPRLAHI
jgi:hypothetical protein